MPAFDISKPFVPMCPACAPASPCPPCWLLWHAAWVALPMKAKQVAGKCPADHKHKAVAA